MPPRWCSRWRRCGVSWEAARLPGWPRYATAAARVPRSGTAAATRWSQPGAASTRTCRRSGSSWVPPPSASTSARAVSKPARSKRPCSAAGLRQAASSFARVRGTPRSLRPLPMSLVEQTDPARRLFQFARAMCIDEGLEFRSRSSNFRAGRRVKGSLLGKRDVYVGERVRSRSQHDPPVVFGRGRASAAAWHQNRGEKGACSDATEHSCRLRPSRAGLAAGAPFSVPWNCRRRAEGVDR